MRAHHAKFGHGYDNPRPSQSKADVVQTSPLRVGHQKGQRCPGHPTFHPAGQVADFGKADAGLRGSVCTGGPLGHQSLRFPQPQG